VIDLSKAKFRLIHAVRGVLTKFAGLANFLQSVGKQTSSPVFSFLHRGWYFMKKVLLFASAMVLGLMSIDSASAGFTAGANTNVALLSSNYTAGGLINNVDGGGQVITTTGDYVGTAASVYSQALGAGPYKVYLVAATANSNFGVTFTGETVVGVAASNGYTGNVAGTMDANVWGSHFGLQAAVKSALEGFYGASAAIDTTVTDGINGVFGTGTQSTEIQQAGIFGNPDSLLVTANSFSGSVNSVTFGGVDGLNELSLVFTTVVPEPTSLGLFGIGTLVFGLVRSRRKKA